MFQPYSIIIILAFTMGLFIWGRWRYDVVALIALMVATVTGAVPFNHVYDGLSNPAVITVACVMVLSQAIIRSGILEPMVEKLHFFLRYTTTHVLSLSLISAIFSAFMNNVGALALMMPVAIQTAIDSKRSPSTLLMPVALGSAMGGLVTLIGTPPNLLVSAYRAQALGSPYSMFDYAHVGIIVAIVGLIYISLVGWRLLPGKSSNVESPEDIFKVQDYITELLIPAESPSSGLTVREFEQLIDEDYTLVGIIRNKRKRLVLRPTYRLETDDILIVEANPTILDRIVRNGKLELIADANSNRDTLRSNDVALMEAVVPQASRIEGRSPKSLRLRSRFQVNLLAIAREGKPFRERLNQVELHAGDVVLLQGPEAALQETISRLGLLPLVGRNLRVGSKKPNYLPITLFAGAIILAATSIMPIQIAFGLAVLLMILFNIIPVRRLYENIEWPIIILLAAMIPVGKALETTGGTGLIAHYLTSLAPHTSPPMVLALLFFITMTLSDFMNNAATAVVMAPIAVTIAQTLHVNVDPFLMAVAVSASCSFLTPVGHQNNTLVMGPGGYTFSDYIKVGLPLEIIIIIVSIPMILYFWPLH